MNMLEQANHVGQGCQTVGVKVAIRHLQHIVLDSPAQRERVSHLEILEQARHVGQGCQTVGVKVTITYFQQWIVLLRESESVMWRNMPDMGAKGTNKLVRTVQV